MKKILKTEFKLKFKKNLKKNSKGNQNKENRYYFSSSITKKQFASMSKLSGTELNSINENDLSSSKTMLMNILSGGRE
ncbi:MAG: hypothetical protein GX217_01535 [Clostridiaceae bacterium]|nr:hypothetical protein [Clostridiaceae bacterium]